MLLSNDTYVFDFQREDTVRIFWTPYFDYLPRWKDRAQIGLSLGGIKVGLEIGTFTKVEKVATLAERDWRRIIGKWIG